MIGIFEQNRLLTAEEVASVLGVKPCTISKWVSEKRIPYVKFGPGKKSIVMFNPKRLNEWIKENSHEPESRNDLVKEHKITSKTSKKPLESFNEFLSSL